MKRLMIQFDSQTHERLKRISFTLRRSMASLVREMVRVGLSKPIPKSGRRREDLGAVATSRRARPGR